MTFRFKIASCPPLLMFLLTLAQPSSSPAQSILGKDFDQFMQDNVKFQGFIENTTGLAISHGSHFFDTSNRFVMNRFTIQPEFIKFRDDLTSFISWRFVKEPRHSMESKSREQSVAPARNGTPLSSAYYHEQSPQIYWLDVIAESNVIVGPSAKAEATCFYY